MTAAALTRAARPRYAGARSRVPGPRTPRHRAPWTLTAALATLFDAAENKHWPRSPRHLTTDPTGVAVHAKEIRPDGVVVRAAGRAAAGGGTFPAAAHAVHVGTSRPTRTGLRHRAVVVDAAEPTPTPHAVSVHTAPAVPDGGHPAVFPAAPAASVLPAGTGAAPGYQPAPPLLLLPEPRSARTHVNVEPTSTQLWRASR
jgi:hypothetical protein